eukprot:1880909-Rhodomonas_salina.4
MAWVGAGSGDEHGVERVEGRLPAIVLSVLIGRCQVLTSVGRGAGGTARPGVAGMLSAWACSVLALRDCGQNDMADGSATRSPPPSWALFVICGVCVCTEVGVCVEKVEGSVLWGLGRDVLWECVKRAWRSRRQA